MMTRALHPGPGTTPCIATREKTDVWPERARCIYSNPIRYPFQYRTTRELNPMKVLHTLGISGLILGAAFSANSAQASDATVAETAQAHSGITVYKSPSCGCCADWAEHLEK